LSEIFSLKKRLKSIKSIQQTSKALQIITAAKIKTMQTLLKAFNEYKGELEEILAMVSPVSFANFYELPKDPKNISIVIIVCSNRGFCGGFNNDVFRTAEKLINRLKNEGKEVKLYLVGKKGIQHYKNKGYPIIGLDLKLADKPDAKSTLRLVSFFITQLQRGQIADVHLVYNEFISILVQKATATKLLPFEQEKNTKSSPLENLILEPDAQKVTQEAFLHFLSVFFLSKSVGSTVGELGARLLVTKNAADSSRDIISQLNLRINKIRQSTITGELSELLSSFQILKEAEA